MKVEMGKKYTCNGESIRILCIDKPGEYPVVGMMEENGDIYYFTENGESIRCRSMNLVEVWEPQEGEWCWFWDSKSSKTIIVSCFVRETDCGKFQCKNGTSWNYCAKFNGELPEHLKGLEDDNITRV
jgi:endonuclease YncB( thermonuclease family)